MLSRVQTLAKRFPQEVNGSAVDAALVTSAENRRYLSGFKTSAGFVLVTKDVSYFLVDFRYYEAASHAVTDCKVVQFSNFAQTLSELIKKHHIRGILLENSGLTLETAARLDEIFSSADACSVKDKTLDTLLWEMRYIKSTEEIQKIKASQQITDAAFAHVLTKIEEGVTERELALEIEFFMRRQGAEGVAFDLIVVAGKNSSLPHGVPGTKRVEKGDFITMDIGALLDGYHSDMTRTIAVGVVSDEQKAVYNTVLKAQLAAISAIKAGLVCKEVDKIARDIIYSAGFEGCFGHGTGHAVGLEIHEKPAFGPSDNTILHPGMIMTVEPGIYLPGRFGVRIEDMVAVTENGCENLTSSKKELIVL